ncbi:hypothetical protein DIPPA_18123 [Diplonema papillatum]|nr:hypothetical protein DIPPA_18123 [Diplonema papillatum]
MRCKAGYPGCQDHDRGLCGVCRGLPTSETAAACLLRKRPPRASAPEVGPRQAEADNAAEEGSADSDNTTTYEEDASSVPDRGQDGEEARPDRADPSDSAKEGAELSPTLDTAD